jgi:hypothetical protein
MIIYIIIYYRENKKITTFPVCQVISICLFLSLAVGKRASSASLFDVADAAPFSGGVGGWRRVGVWGGKSLAQNGSQVGP